MALSFRELGRPLFRGFLAGVALVWGCATLLGWWMDGSVAWADEPTPAADVQPAVEEAPVPVLLPEDAPTEEAETAPPPAQAPRSVADLQDASTQTTVMQRLLSIVGIFAFLGLAWLLSNNRRRVNWRIVGVGVSLQLAFALFILKTPIGRPLFEVLSSAFVRVLNFTREGSQFLFASFVMDNQIHPALVNFVFDVLPTIIFFSSLMTVLYYLGIMQRVVAVVAWVMQRTMGTSGSETTSASANIFVGQTEAPLMVKPFIARMTSSELMAVMTAGFATVAGGVLALYIQFLNPHFPGIASHLMAASVMAAPGALVIAKIMFPETETSETQGDVQVDVEKTDANVIDAAARGASEGLQLALNVAAMLLAFVALIALINYLFGLPSYLQHGVALNTLWSQLDPATLAALPQELVARCSPDGAAIPMDTRAGCIAEIQAAAASAPEVRVWPTIQLETIFGVLFFPFAFLIGAPLQDCFALAQLLGQKMVVNELFAYLNLSIMIQDPDIELQPRTILLATYALCGFANFSSIAIQIGGIGSIAPNRRGDLARLGLRAMIGGTITAFLTATVAGLVF